MRTLPSVHLALILGAFVPAFSYAASWPAVDPAELAETQGRVDPSADCEYLLYECTEDGTQYDRRNREYFVRLRVFTQAGAESASIIELPYRERIDVGGISVRTTRPDGTTVEHSKVQTFDREVLRLGVERRRVATFTPPAVEPGVLIEYRFTTYLDRGHYETGYFFQRHDPVRLARYRVRPYHERGKRLRMLFFNLPEKDIKPDKDAYFVFEFEELKGMRHEPFSPPPLHTQASISIKYVDPSEADVARYWSGQGRELQRAENRTLKATPRVKALAASIVAPSDSPEVKLSKFYDHCRAGGIINRDSPKIPFTYDELKKLQVNSAPDDTIECGNGTARDINELFAALAATTGLETKLARVNDRGIKLVRPDSADPESVSHLVVAVKLDGKWVVFDPGEMFLPFGLLSWRHTDTLYMMASRSGGVLEAIEGSKAEDSVRTRRGELRLDENGNLEGNVTITHTGLWDAEVRKRLFPMTHNERLELVKDDVRRFLRGAEVTDILVENGDELLKPLRISYRIRFPGYAARTGTRLLVRPAVFQKGVSPLFQNSSRTYDIVFQNRRTDLDEVEIALPEGFSIEAHSAPPVPNLAPLARYETYLALKKETNTLIYKRTFRLDSVMALARFYAPIKQLFEAVDARDSHEISLRRVEPAAQQTGAR
ncbi:MAG TPA: DUF3857 and transglutaminase domain-containing protein [Opitutaceae bacterium]